MARRKSRYQVTVPIDFDVDAPPLWDQLGDLLELTDGQLNALNLERDQYVIECVRNLNARGLLNDAERNRVFKRLNQFIETHLTSMYAHDFYGVE